MNFRSFEEYENFLDKQIPLPEGVSFSSCSLDFFPVELGEGAKSYPMNLTLIALDEPTESFSALYTKNAFPGHPVVIGKELLEEKRLKALIINNKIANVECPDGYGKSRKLIEELGHLLPGEGVVFPFSTGIIGWELPYEEMKAALPDLAASRKSASALGAAKAIMTTDSFPKARTVTVGECRITGICKGAGMIEPNMATMLVFVMTDADLDRDELSDCWEKACQGSFNRISVDSDQSTSDSALIFSTKKKPVDREEFAAALEELTIQMAQDIVRNGEGTGHVMEVLVEEALSEEEAVSAGKALVNSPLTKSAVNGNDPNVGRLIQALGDWAGNGGFALDRKKVTLSLGDTDLYKDGAFLLDSKKEILLHDYMKERALPLPSPGFPAHGKNVKITVRLGRGREQARVWGSDLSCDYVRINAEYRS
ncbi:MAG: bifunctional ornithine acetyltransferase/N-acetylglutamate synthase [Spirochaetales bacterium]|nr:bifunctional ornithine acetyltransferase/N-acetylglutamate synthase [Spirochaetales bacterium]